MHPRTPSLYVDSMCYVYMYLETLHLHVCVAELTHQTELLLTMESILHFANCFCYSQSVKATFILHGQVAVLLSLPYSHQTISNHLRNGYNTLGS